MYNPGMATPATLPPPEAVDLPLTVDDWFTWPDDGHQYELFEGVLLRMSPPSRKHQDAVGEVFIGMKDASRASGGYVAVAPLGIALEERLGFLPDVVYVAADRLYVLSDRGVEAAPDIVVEVLSRSTAAFDRGTKLTTYLAHGVKEVWLVDLVARTVTVHSASAAPQTAPFGAPVPSAILPGVGDCGLGSL
jgi:Uma2 family endonuclease